MLNDFIDFIIYAKIITFVKINITPIFFLYSFEKNVTLLKLKIFIEEKWASLFDSQR